MGDASQSVVRLGLLTTGPQPSGILLAVLSDPRFELAWLSSLAESPAPFAQNVPLLSSDEAGGSTNVDAVVIDVAVGDRARTAREWLDTHPRLAVPLPLSDSTSVLRQLWNAADARQSAPVLISLPTVTCTAEDWFCQQAIHSGRWTPPVHAERIQKLPGFLAADETCDSRSEFVRWLTEQVTQMACLLPGTFTHGQLQTTASPEKASADGFHGVIALTDDTGSTVRLSCQRDTRLVYDSGWILSSANGGFAAGRVWTREPDGECYDTTPSLVDPDRVLMLDQLFDQLRMLPGSGSSQNTVSDAAIKTQRQIARNVTSAVESILSQIGD